LWGFVFDGNLIAEDVIADAQAAQPQIEIESAPVVFNGETRSQSGAGDQDHNHDRARRECVRAEAVFNPVGILLQQPARDEGQQDPEPVFAQDQDK